MQGSRTGKDSHQERRSGTNCKDLVLSLIDVDCSLLPDEGVGSVKGSSREKLT